ncbi:hypothetical protein SDC9_116715 [bioreactor metagenome]|uniref:Uncharacterized protein n=1 Tax=bioreactor metagenome TaxID=1076179 RepID=A0A645BX59_9ZZZZ
MYGDGPSQTDRVLYEYSQFFFFNLFLFFVVPVTYVSPRVFLHIALLTVIRYNVNGSFFVDAAHYTDGAVDPALFVIVFNEDDL